MATRKATSASKTTTETAPAKKAAAKKTAAAPKATASVPKAPKKPSAAKAKVTMADLAARIDELAARIEELTRLLGAKVTPAEAAPSPAPARDAARFEEEIVRVVRDLDTRGRFGGMVPIPEARGVFLEAGWTREAFDRALVAAERDFVVDLKIANDPSRLARPELAIDDASRGLLQYVVAR